MIIISQPAIAQTFTERGEAHDFINELRGEITVEVEGEKSVGADRQEAHRELERLVAMLPARGG